MTKKLIAFDLDGTLAPSKSHFTDRMVNLFDHLLEKYHVCVISGGKYEIFQRQFLSQITQEPDLLTKLHIMPTSGTRYYRHEKGKWILKYAENIPIADKARIKQALETGLDEAGYREKKLYGDLIEDRESQISLSIFGQEIVAELGKEGLEIKENWDPDGKKKLRLRDIIAPKIPDYEVRAAGATTIDVTMPGVDKAYGMKKLIEATNLAKEDILFMGDKIIPGGNDYAVEQFGIDCIAVRSWEDTAYAIEAIVKVS